MTALAANRATQAYDDFIYNSYPVKASAIIYQGSLVVLAAGYATPGAATSTYIAVGRAEEYVDNTGGADGAKNVRVRSGVFKFANSSAGDAIAQADVGAFCYVVDDQTVAKTSNGGARPRAGKIVAIDTGGVFVSIAPFIVPTDAATLTGSETLTAKRIRMVQGGAISFTTNDVTVAVADGNSFDCPTTGAASTIKLSATATKGDRITIRFNGTLNGHQVTVQDATGPTSLAVITASKRAMFTGEFDGTVWVGQWNISP